MLVFGFELLEWIGAVVERRIRDVRVVSSSLTTVLNSLTALDKLLTTNVHPLDPGDEWVPGLGQYLPSAPEKIVVAAWGVCSPGSWAGYGIFRSAIIKARGLNIVKSSEYFGIGRL